LFPLKVIRQPEKLRRDIPLYSAQLGFWKRKLRKAAI